MSAAIDPRGARVRVSRFANVYATVPEPLAGSLAELLGPHRIIPWDRAGMPPSDPKVDPRRNELPLICGALFREGTTRKQANVACVTLLAHDVDHLAPDDVVEIDRLIRAIGVGAVIHTTWSHRADGAGECLRYYFLLSRDVTLAEWPAFWMATNALLLGGRGDPATKNADRMMFVPSAPTERVEHAWMAAIEGQPIDVDALLADAEDPSSDAAAPAGVPPEMVARLNERARTPRHDLLRTLAMQLARKRLDKATILAHLRATNDSFKDPKAVSELERLAQSAMEKVAADATEDGRPEIVVRDELAAMTDEAEAALVVAAHVGVYQRAGILVQVGSGASADAVRSVRRVGSAPVIVPLRVAALLEKLDRAAHWVEFVKATGEERALGDYKKVDARPDGDVARALEARATWTLPHLTGVTQMPTLRIDGSVLDVPGYDRTTGLLYLPNAAYPPIPDRPTADEVDDAVAALLDPLSEFPFVEPYDKAAAIAAIFSCAGRYAIAGAVPAFGVNACAPGTGKGLLVSAITTIGTGRAPGRMTLPKDDGEELRKTILALALEGDPAILVDNVEEAVGSDALASVITDLTVKGRVLGVSKMAEGECAAVWFVTGNSLRFKGDLGRRVLRIDLDAGVELPEVRRFKRAEPLLAYVERERPRLAVAAITILRAYVVAGLPPHQQGPPIGSFEAWDALVRGACLWLGFEDPAAGRERVRAEGDADLDALRTLIAAVYEVQRDASWIVSALVRLAAGSANDELREALLAFGDGREPNPWAIGRALDRYQGRIVDGKCLRRGLKGAGGVWKWRIEVVS